MWPVIVIAVVALALVGVGGYFLLNRRAEAGPELEPPVSGGGTIAPPRPSTGDAVGPFATGEVEAVSPVIEEVPTEVEPEPEPEPPRRKPTFRERLAKARIAFAGILGREKIDQDTWDDLEEALIRAEVGDRARHRACSTT